ncbi:MAG: GAP family protein [Gordonia sp. (in: high G+C Gram-positive bacteria)]
MWGALGGSLGMAMGFALSPLAIVTALVLVLGDNGRTRTAGFVVGWFAAVFVITGLASWITDTADDEVAANSARDGIDLLHLIFGILFFVLAVVTWVKRPQHADGSELETPDDALVEDLLDREERGKAAKPTLLERIDNIGVLGALGFGLAQGVLIIKNIPLGISAGTTIGSVGMGAADTVVVLVIFSAVASLGGLIPLVVMTFGGERVEESLRNGRDWFEHNMTAVTLVVLVLLGGIFVGEGLGLAS